MPLPGGEWALSAPSLFQELENLGHPLAFGLLGYLWLRHGNQNPAGGWIRRYGVVLVGLTAIGALAELLQWATGRDPSWRDVMGNSLGAGLAIALHSRRRWPAGSLLMLVLLGALALAPLSWTLAAYAHRARQAPVLWRPDSRLFQRFWHGTQDPYPGFTIDEPLRDWRIWEMLDVRIANASQQEVRAFVTIRDRGHDAYDDRFNGEYMLAPAQVTTIRIPLEQIASAPRGRRLELGRIGSVSVFQVAERAEPPMQVLDIRLAHGD